jgi:hypothetical protein
MVAAACSSSPKKPGNIPTVTLQPRTSTSSTPASTSTSTSTSTTTTAPATGCTGVSATVGPTQGAAGTITGSIILTETGTSNCPLKGYPTMALFGSGGTHMPVTIVDGLTVSISSAANGPPASVVLSPSAKVEFTYQFSDVPTGSQTACLNSNTASVTLPGNSTSTAQFTLMMDPCNGTIHVSPIYAAS